MEKADRYKILEWNINQATDKYGKNRLPDLVIKELKRQNPDIIVLTEFRFCVNAGVFLDKAFIQRNYDYFPKRATQNTDNGQNEILIAWRKELFNSIPDQSKSEVVTWTNNKPNYVRVLLNEKKRGQYFYVVGIRITMAKKIPDGLSKEEENKAYQEQAELRREQMEYVYGTLVKFPIVIIAGDFNNYRRGSDLKRWNINELNCGSKEYKIFTPLGQSIYKKEGKNVNFEFAEDHFITKGCIVKDYSYDRKFTMWDEEKKIYHSGEDFNWEELKGYPDHAILSGDLYLEMEDE